MHHSEGKFTGQDGLALYYQRWLPDRDAQAVLGIVPGLGSHSGLFSNLVNYLVPRGYAIYSVDLRGHGRSPGQRGYINAWSEFRADFGSFWQLVTSQHPTLPGFVLGHSLGAVIVLDYALRQPDTLAGVIAMAPAIGPVGVSPIRLAIGQLLSQVVPRFTLNTGIPQNAGSQDAAVVAAYQHDPLRHTKGTARLVTEFLQTVRYLRSHIANLQMPMLILHGSADPVALPASSQLLFEQLPIADKEYREYPNAYHDLHNDIYAEQVAADISNWLDRHIRGELTLCKLRD